MAYWIWALGSWHELAKVEKVGWITKCGTIVFWDAAVLDEAPPAHERRCSRCAESEKEPVT